MLQLSRGGDDVVRYHAFPPAYLLNHPAHVRRALVEEHGRYSKDTPLGVHARSLIGRGVLTLDGTEWRQRRRLMQPAFHRPRIEARGSLMVRVAQDTADGWGPLADSGEVVDVSVEMTALVLRIAVEGLFDVDVRERALELAPVLAPADVVGMPLREPDRVGLDALLQLSNDVTRERRDRGDTGSDDVLSVLLQSPPDAPGRPRDDDELREEVAVLLLAAVDTTSATLTWTWYLLSQAPEVRARLEAEIDRALGDRDPTVRDLPSLPFARAVLEESLRLYPPGWVMGRRLRTDDRLGEHHLQAGVVVALSPYTIQRSGELWQDPDGFAPERFLGGSEQVRRRFAYFPFGAGPRQCIGEAFAMAEAHLALATIARRFRLELAPGAEVRPEARNIIRPRGGMPMTIHRRGTTKP